MGWTYRFDGEDKCLENFGGETFFFGKQLFGRPRRRWHDNIKLDLRELDCEV
jgi:hypothetical protein